MVVDSFRERFGSDATMLIRAPGRVNLIGEHTDYNDGFVLPIAIDRAIWIALRPRTDRRVVLHSLDFNATASLDLDDLKQGTEGWIEYIKGVAWEFENGLAEQRDKRLTGWEGVSLGDVPRGAGLSSSAAIELAVARAFAEVNDIPWDARQMALLAQRVENRWVGMQCGIMDQMVIASGQEGMAILIDCRSLAIEPAPLPVAASVVILDTSTRRGLVDSEYNRRRTLCEVAARHAGVVALRDLTSEQFHEMLDVFPDDAIPKARHVITENARTLSAADAMRAGDAVRLGQLMNASHESLRYDFQVSSRELDIMVDLARAQDACYGARMTGAGFGGCAIALVDRRRVSDFSSTVSKSYQAATGLVPKLYDCRASNGVEAISLPGARHGPGDGPPVPVAQAARDSSPDP
jgi:galactokinase